MRHVVAMLTAVLLISLCGANRPKAADAPLTVGGKAGQAAPEFPPGAFSDGGHYRLSDFRGKVVVLFFYEQQCPRCRGLIPERNKVVAAFKDQPVVFIAIAAGDSLADAKAYIRDTGLQMVTFADNLSIMEHQYGFHLSLNNIYQFRVIGPGGAISAYDMDVATIQAVLAKVKPRYNADDYDKKLAPALQQFEFNQYEAGMKLLKPLRKSPTKTTADSANKLYEAIHSEGEQWKSTAEKVRAEKPAEAYDLYTRIASVFASEDLAVAVAGPIKELKADKAVVAELAARARYAQLNDAVARATSAQTPQVTAFCQQIARDYPGTPTAEKAQALATALQSQPAGQ